MAAAIPRAPADARIDPFTLAEPWRRYVTDALQARTRFAEAVGVRPGGPDARPAARDPGPGRHRACRRCGASPGAATTSSTPAGGSTPTPSGARSPPPRPTPSQPWATDSTTERTLESLQAQLATVERLERVIGDADSRLRLLNARLDEAAARTIELSVQAHDVAELGGLGDDVDQMVDEMEALRQAIEETGGGTAVAGTG